MSNVCILLSTYNGQVFLQEQIDSITSQRFEGNIQVIVRDDGSSDATTKILEDWSHLFDVTIINGNNIGPKASFLELVQRAPVADFYVFCDQDDVWRPTKMASGVEQLLKMPQNKPNLYFANAEFADESLQSDGVLFHKEIPNYSLLGAMVCNPALGCTTMFNRNLMEIVKNVFPVHTSMHDKFFLLTAILLGNVTYDHTPQMKYRQHSSNVCGREGDYKKRIRQTFKLWFGSKDTSLGKQAEELLKFYGNRISDVHKNELSLFVEYKSSIAKKIKLLKSRDIKTTHYKANRSFVLRTVLNLA